jgi:hypothetical protein
MKKPIWIYESPDKGKTIYRRPFGKDKPKKLVKLKGINIKIYNN